MPAHASVAASPAETLPSSLPLLEPLQRAEGVLVVLAQRIPCGGPMWGRALGECETRACCCTVFQASTTWPCATFAAAMAQPREPAGDARRRPVLPGLWHDERGAHSALSSLPLAPSCGVPSPLHTTPRPIPCCPAQQSWALQLACMFRSLSAHLARPCHIAASGSTGLHACAVQDARYAIIAHVVHLVNRDYQVMPVSRPFTLQLCYKALLNCAFPRTCCATVG